MSVIDNPVIFGQLAKGCLQSEPIRLQVLQKAIPPVEFFLGELVESRFGYSIPKAGLYENFAAYTAVP
jgi:hypothetical protein